MFHSYKKAARERLKSEFDPFKKMNGIATSLVDIAYHTVAAIKETSSTHRKESKVMRKEARSRKDLVVRIFWWASVGMNRRGLEGSTRFPYL